jgi:uncharacterized protein
VSAFPDRSDELKRLVGLAAGPPQLAPHAVNEPMIRHWVEAMGDHNPVYVSPDAARAVGLPGVIAPPTMLQAWIMRGLRASEEVEAARAARRPASDTATDAMMALLDDEGRTSVVATNCEQQYLRPLGLSDRLLVCSVIESVSDAKETALGEGRFITTRLDFSAVTDEEGRAARDPSELAGAGELVATMRFRILKFRPKAPAPPPKAAPAPPNTGASARSRRPRPAITQDNAFFFEGTRAGKLLVQRCASCGTLRHPPLPACAHCRSLEWDTVESSGRGTLYSYVVVHHPQVPGFDYPLPIGLVELEEGTRIVANLEGAPLSAWRIGMPVALALVAVDDELTLPAFVPAEAGS